MLDNSEGTALEKALGKGQASSGISAKDYWCRVFPMHSGCISNAVLQKGRLQLILRSSSGTWRCTISARSASQLCDGAVKFLQMCALPEGNNYMKADLVLF